MTGTKNDEILTGGKGSDTLTGGGGFDTFNYSDLTISDFLDGNVDIITDFGSDDNVQIESAILQGHTNSSNIFDYISYNSSTGALLLDIDASGSTSAVQFAILDSGLSLTAENFVII